MLDSVKIGGFISGKRRELGMTQQQLADRLNISFQAVSKWEYISQCGAAAGAFRGHGGDGG